MSKETAVKWLEKAFYESAWSAYAESTGINNKWLIDEECLAGLFNQAKAMEREQIEDAFREGKRDGWQNHKLKTEDKDYQWTNSMEYYNSTYKGGEQ